MLRAALRPAPLALLVLALAVATACALLGQWQAERSRASTAQPALERVVPLAEVLAPATAFPGRADGQVVEATGEFAGGEQLLVDGRLQDGEPGRWVLAPLAVAGPDGRVSVLPVVRGWVEGGADAVPAPPTGPVRVVGRLIAGEPPQGVVPAQDGAAPVVRAVSPADLVNVWDGPLHTGFVIAAEPVPPAPLEVAPSRAPSAGTDWRNLSYAVQWWVFAGFAIVVWWRVVRDRFLLPEAGAAGDARGGPLPPPEPAHGPGEPPAPGWEDGPDRAPSPGQRPQEVR